MRTGASGIASKIFQRRLGYHRSCSRYQYVIWGLQHRLSSPRILLQGGSGIAGVVPGTNVGLRLSSPTTINTLGLEGRCCRTTPLWGNSLSVFLPTHLNADSFGTEGSSGVHVSPKSVGVPMAFISPKNMWVLWSMYHHKVCGTRLPTRGFASHMIFCGWRSLRPYVVGGGPYANYVLWVAVLAPYSQFSIPGIQNVSLWHPCVT